MTRFFIFLLTVSATADRIAVAVHDFKGEGLEESSARIISERIRSELVNTGVFRVMERGEMETILKEQGFQQSGACTDQACLVEVGQLLGVQYMIAGSIGKLGSLFTLSTRMISVETGEIHFAAHEDCQCSIEDLLSGPVPALARNLAAKTTGRDAAAEEKKLFGTLEVESVPPGAKLSLDGKVVGTTPYANNEVPPGTHLLALNLAKYKQKEERISIDTKKPLKLPYVLEKDRMAGKKRVQTFRKVAFGACAAGFGLAGIYLNGRLEEDYKEYTEFKVYDQKVHDDNWKKVESTQIQRNIAYGLCGLSAVLFGLSFAF